MGTHKFIQQQDIAPAADKSPYIRRLKKSLARKSIDYEPKTETTNDIPEIETLTLATEYPDSVVKNIGWFYRVLLPNPEMFELDENTGQLDTQHKQKQALIYHLNCYITDPRAKGGSKKKVIGFNRIEGMYQDPIPEYKYDRYGKPVDWDQVGHRNIFYIPYSPENIDKILNEMSNHPNTIGVCVASEDGSLPWLNNPYTVHNFQEFRDIEDIEGLIEANVGVEGHGTFLKKEYGGYDKYMEWKKANKSTTTNSTRGKREYKPPSDE